MQGAKGRKRAGKNMRNEGGKAKKKTREKFRGESRKQGTGLKSRSKSARTEKESALACARRQSGLPTAVAQENAIKKAPLFGGAKGHFARMRCPVISR